MEVLWWFATVLIAVMAFLTGYAGGMTHVVLRHGHKIKAYDHSYWVLRRVHTELKRGNNDQAPLMAMIEEAMPELGE